MPQDWRSAAQALLDADPELQPEPAKQKPSWVDEAQALLDADPDLQPEPADRAKDYTIGTGNNALQGRFTDDEASVIAATPAIQYGQSVSTYQLPAPPSPKLFEPTPLFEGPKPFVAPPQPRAPLITAARGGMRGVVPAPGQGMLEAVPFSGPPQVMRGVLALPGPPSGGVPTGDAPLPVDLSAIPGAASDIIEGTFKTLTPVFIGMGIANPIETAKLIAETEVGQELGGAIAKIAGLGEEGQRLTRNVSALLAIGNIRALVNKSLGQVSGVAYRGAERVRAAREAIPKIEEPYIDTTWRSGEPPAPAGVPPTPPPPAGPVMPRPQALLPPAPPGRPPVMPPAGPRPAPPGPPGPPLAPPAVPPPAAGVPPVPAGVPPPVAPGPPVTPPEQIIESIRDDLDELEGTPPPPKAAPAPVPAPAPAPAPPAAPKRTPEEILAEIRRKREERDRIARGEPPSPPAVTPPVTPAPPEPGKPPALPQPKAAAPEPAVPMPALAPSRTPTERMPLADRATLEAEGQERLPLPEKSFKAEVTDGSGWASNALRFKTPEEAHAYGRDLMSRWMGAKDMRVAESDEPVKNAWHPQEGLQYLDKKPVPVSPKFELTRQEPGGPTLEQQGQRRMDFEAPPTRAELEAGGQQRLAPEKPSALPPKAPPTTPKTEGRSFAARVYEALTKQGAFEALPENAVALRKHIAQLVGHDEAVHGDVPLNQMEDAIEGVLADRLSKTLDRSAPLAKQIDQALTFEDKMPNAHRSLEKKSLQQFSTPLPIGVAAVHAAQVTPNDQVAEPTAGTGNLVAALPSGQAVRVNELGAHRADLLDAQGYPVTRGDYLAHDYGKGKAPTVIITNPPWGKYTTGKYGHKIAADFTPNDVAERFAAKNMEDLAPGGRLVAIMPTTMLQPTSYQFRKWLGTQGTVVAVIQSPAGSYKTRGTDVESVMLVVDKGGTTTDAQWADLLKDAAAVPASWEDYAGAVEAIPERVQNDAGGVGAAPQPGGGRTGPARKPVPRGGPGAAGPGADVPVDRPGAPPVVGKPESGKSSGTPEPATGSEPGAGDTTPAGAAGRPGPGPAGKTLAKPLSPERQAVIDRLKKRAAERTTPTANKPLADGGGGEQGFAMEAAPTSDADLLDLITLLQQSLEDGLVNFGEALEQLAKDFGDGWVLYKDILPDAWETLKADYPAIDEARPVDEALREAVIRRIQKSEDWRVYERRKPELTGSVHPKPVTEAKALSGVPYPALTIDVPAHMQKAATEGRASVEQVEQAMAAVQANTKGDKPHGYLIADAVGLGKSREIAMTVNEFMRIAKEKGEDARILILTKSQTNVADLLENFAYMWSGRTEEGKDLNTGQIDEKQKGSVPYKIVNLAEWSAAKKDKGDKDYTPLPTYKAGVYIAIAPSVAPFYPALHDLKLTGIVGDEAHELKNVGGSDKGAVWRALHGQIFKNVPRDQQRFLYASATATQDVEDYEYLYGLRLWPIDGFGDWVNLITGRLTGPEAAKAIRDADTGIRDPNTNLNPPGSPGGPPKAPGKRKAPPRASSAPVAAVTSAEMEQIPRELKMLGRLSARDLWREGTEFEIHRAELPAKHVQAHNDFGTLAREILDAVQQFGAMNKTTAANKTMIATSMVQFFAKRMALQSAMEEAITLAKDYIAQGYQPVFRVLNIKKTGQDTKAQTIAEDEDDGGIEEEVRGHLAAAVNAINVENVVVDPNTGAITNLGQIPEAMRVKARLMERVKDMTLDSPVTMMEQAFGKENVAAKIGGMTKAKEAAVKEFQAGKRQALLISSAGSTGINLDHRVWTTPPAGHTGPWAGGRRAFIVVQFDWSASQEIQAIGRVDRTSSITPPLIMPITFGNAAEGRFLGAVANRLASTGATARGGASATGSAKGYAEFEVGGSDMLAAIRDVWRDTDDAIRDQFWGKRFRSPGGGNSDTLPNNLTIAQVQRALLLVNLEDANAFWKDVLAQREVIRKALDVGAEARTKARAGEVIRDTPLTDTLKLYEVKNEEGHRFGLLVGVIMPHMPRIRTYLPIGTSGNRRRSYMSFSAKDGRTLTGLEIMPSQIHAVATEFGKDFGAAVLDTPEKVQAALNAGDTVPLVQRNEHGHRWKLKIIQGTKLIRIANARMADEAILKANGADFRPQGQSWIVLPGHLPEFLERFPTAHPAELEAERKAEAASKETEGKAEAEREATYGTSKTQPYQAGKPQLPKSPVVPVKPKAGQLGPREIIKSLEKLGVKIRVGGYRSSRGSLIVHGIFRLGQFQSISTKIANDLPVTAHEVGHALDHRYGFTAEAGAQPHNPQAQGRRYELLALGNATSGPNFTQKQRLMEGVAEFTRLWLTEPAEAQRLAPDFYAQFEKTLSGDHKAILDEAQRQIHGIIMADPVERARLKIDMAGATPNKDTRSLFRKFHARLFNDYEGILTPVKVMGEPENVREHAFKLAVNARSSDVVAHGMLKYGIKGTNDQFLTRGLGTILEPVSGRINDFVLYITMLRARELMQRGKETGFSPTEIHAVINKYKNTADFEPVRKELKGFTDAMLTYLYQHGILDSDAVTAMRDAGEYYVPMQRVMDAYHISGKVSGKKASQLADQASPLRRMSRPGSARTVINPLESIHNNVFAMVEAAMQNDAAVAFVEHAEKTQWSGEFIHRISTPAVAQVFDLARFEKEIRAKLARQGVDLPQDIDLHKIVRLWMPALFADGNQHYLTVLRKGKRYFYSVNDPALYEALAAMGPIVAGPIMKLFMPAARIARLTKTGLNIVFGAKSPVKDTFTSFVQTRFGFKLGYDTVRGLYHSILNENRGPEYADERYKQFMTSPVMGASMLAGDRRRVQQSLRQLTGQKAADFRTRLFDTVMTPYDLLHAMIDLTAEQSTRYGAYLRSLEKELTDNVPGVEARARAAWQASNAPIHYRVGGSWVRSGNTVKAFMNANVRGVAQTVNAFKENPVGFTLKAVGTISMLSALLWYVNHDDDQYDELSEPEKNGYWYIPAPFTKSGFIPLPKPPGLLGLVFGNAVELALDHLFEHDPELVMARLQQVFGGRGKGIVMDALQEFLLQVMPDAVGPGLENISNYDNFRNRDVINPWMLNKENDLQFNRYTPETIKQLAGWIDIAPLYLEHFIYGHTGSMGIGLFQGLDVAESMVGLRPKSAEPIRWSKVPPITAFYREGLDESASSIRQVYRQQKIAEGAKASIADYTKAGETEKAQALQAKRGDLINKLPNLNAAVQAMKTYPQQLEVLRKDQDMPLDEKEKQRDAIYTAWVNTARSFLGKPAMRERGYVTDRLGSWFSEHAKKTVQALP